MERGRPRKEERRPVTIYIASDLFEVFERIPDKQDYINLLLRRDLFGSDKALSVQELAEEKTRIDKEREHKLDELKEIEKRNNKVDMALQARTSAESFKNRFLGIDYTDQLQRSIDALQQYKLEPATAYHYAGIHATRLRKIGGNITADELLQKAFGSREEVR